ncbi:MAG TPA: hypothetical protein VF134_08810 [Candidatus Dormibacteraeota bacterium]
MLEVVVGSLAAVLVLAGIGVIAGPFLPRFARSLLAGLRRPVRPAALAPRPQRATEATGLHPTTMRALTAAARIYSLLRANGEDRLAGELRSAARRVRSDESKGLLALTTVLRALREVSIEDEEADQRLRRQLGELRDAVRDRSEQLELLQF